MSSASSHRPFVSVVIPTYNHGQFIGDAIQSVIDQTFSNWEVLVIDNHSTDNTDEVVSRFGDPRISVIKIHNNGVIAASRNAGIREAKGDWVAFLDSDDWWASEKLQVCCECIREEVDFIYHGLKIVRDNSSNFKRRSVKARQVKTPVLIDLLINTNAIATSSVLVRKCLLEQVGGMSEAHELIASEDYNTWLKVASLTNGFKYLPVQLGFYRIHGQGASQKDMSIPTRHAANEFMHVLNDHQKVQLEAALKYMKGRYNYLASKPLDANPDLLFSLMHGDVFMRVKALFMLVMIKMRKHS